MKCFLSSVELKEQYCGVLPKQHKIQEEQLQEIKMPPSQGLTDALLVQGYWGKMVSTVCKHQHRCKTQAN